jgi:hypothetical protein
MRNYCATKQTSINDFVGKKSWFLSRGRIKIPVGLARMFGFDADPPMASEPLNLKSDGSKNDRLVAR